MLKYQIIGGEHIEAPDYPTLTEALKSLDQTPYADMQTYMEATAHACALSNSATIRTDSPEAFISDLEKFGFIRKSD